MLKTLLGFAAFCILSFAGFQKSASISTRVKVIECMTHDIVRLVSLMRYKMLPIDKLLADEKGFDCIGFWDDFKTILKSSDSADEAWKQAVAKHSSCEGMFCRLSEFEKSLILDFGSALGNSDIRSQETNARMTLERLNETLVLIKLEHQKKGRMYRSVGLLGGIAAAIIIW